MAILFLGLLCIILYQISTKKISGFHEDYMGTSQTIAMKGIFAVVILFSHMRTYIALDGNTYDVLFNSILNAIGQLMVAIFLFYSGYGVFCAYKNKDGYEETFLKKRILKTLLHFDLAVFLYLLLNIWLQTDYELSNYILCWTGWKAIGNSKWFIFDIIALYLVTYVVFQIIKKIKPCTQRLKEIKTVFLIFVGTGVLILVLFLAKRNEGSWWYDTLLCYPVGMMYALYKEKIDLIMKKWIGWGSAVLFCGCVFVSTYFAGSFVAFNICACAFVFLIVLMTMKIKLANPILLWLGRRSFSIYILQRLPMLIMTYLGINEHRYVFAILSIVLALALAEIFDRMLGVIDKKLFS